MLQASVDMKESQGLSAMKVYSAKVVDNNDPRQLGRIRARVDVIFDGIQDEHLPWAIPSYMHCDGASNECGFFAVPKVGSKVSLRFQEGNPFYPEYHGYTVDEVVSLPESKHNYPDRVVALYKNKCILVIDTKSNEIFFRNPGDFNLYVQGNVYMQVDGNVTERIKGNKTTVIDGNHIVKIKGSHRVDVDGSEKITVGASRSVHTTGTYDNHTTGNVSRTGSRIDDNPSRGASARPTAVTDPSSPPWPAIRNETPD